MTHPWNKDGFVSRLELVSCIMLEIIIATVTRNSGYYYFQQLQLSKKWEVQVMSLWWCRYCVAAICCRLSTCHLHESVLFPIPYWYGSPRCRISTATTIAKPWHDDPLFYTKQALSIASLISQEGAAHLGSLGLCYHSTKQKPLSHSCPPFGST